MSPFLMQRFERYSEIAGETDAPSKANEPNEIQYAH